MPLRVLLALCLAAPAAADPLSEAAAIRFQAPVLTGKSPAPALDKENAIFLADLRLRDKTLASARKDKLRADLKLVVEKANAGFAQKGLPPRVQVLDDIAEIAKASDLKASQVLATIGTTPQLVAAQAQLEAKGFDEMQIENMGPEKGSCHGAARFLPNGDYSTESDRGDRLAIDVDAFDVYLKTFAIDELAFTAWLIQHGSIHNAGLSHNNEPNYRASSGFENVPDLSTGGNYYLKHKDQFQTHRDNVSDKLRGLYTAQGKFKKD